MGVLGQLVKESGTQVIFFSVFQLQAETERSSLLIHHSMAGVTTRILWVFHNRMAYSVPGLLTSNEFRLAHDKLWDETPRLEGQDASRGTQVVGLRLLGTPEHTSSFTQRSKGLLR